MKYETIMDAVNAWVGEMNAIPTGMVQKLVEYEPEAWHNVTVPSKNDRVYVLFDGDNPHGPGEIIDIEDDTYTIELDSGETVVVEPCEFEMEDELALPMWGTMWQFGDSADDYWLTELGGLRLMSECGFSIWESDEFGYFFGIDGAGYSFKDEHWIPLYKARGLHWHKEEDDEE